MGLQHGSIADKKRKNWGRYNLSLPLPTWPGSRIYVKCDNVFRQSQLFILTQLNLFESVILPLKDYYCWCMWRLHRNLTQNYFKNIEVGWKNWIYGDSSVTDLWVRLIDHIILASIFDSEPSFLYFVRILFKFSNNKYIIHAYWIVSASSNLERWRGNMGLIFCWNTCMEEMEDPQKSGGHFLLLLNM